MSLTLARSQLKKKSHPAKRRWLLGQQGIYLIFKAWLPSGASASARNYGKCFMASWSEPRGARKENWMEFLWALIIMRSVNTKGAVISKQTWRSNEKLRAYRKIIVPLLYPDKKELFFHPQKKQKTFGSTISAFPRFPEVNTYVQHVQYSSLLPGNLGNWVFGDSQVKEKRTTAPLARLPSGSGAFGEEFRPLNKASLLFCFVLVLFARTASKSEWLPIELFFFYQKK